MVRMIIGDNGKGKSKVLLEKVNSEVKEVLGNVVFLDSSTKHMFELNNKVRLINVSEYLVKNSDMFVGLLSGILSQDHDLQQMYFDNFLEIANCSIADMKGIVDDLEEISDKFNVDMFLSVSTSKGSLPEGLNDKVMASL